jgi:ABC-2 type transport system permease protein
MHYLRIYWVAIRNNLIREAVYRVNFLTGLVIDIVWFGLEFSLFSVLYANVHTLAGWTKPQVYFFLGLFFLSDALFAMLFQRSFWSFAELVNRGELDIFLLKPVSSVFLILTRYINVSVCLNVIFGLIVMIRFADQAGFSGGWSWLWVICWAFVGLLTALLLRFAFCVVVFWTERGWSLSHLYYQFFQLATKPDTMYPVIIRNVIRTALPFAFIGSVPARALLFGISTGELLGVFAVLASFFVLDVTLWKKGLNRYQSASS